MYQSDHWVRGSGKSYLLLLLRGLLLENEVGEDQIIYLNFEHPDYYDLQTYEALYAYLKSQVSSEQKIYF
ncbi:MAG: AAA family ATPase [Streptococcaceae bacterium]|nr:AAA family ATPase [Streptococcaceae bacterium]